MRRLTRLFTVTLCLGAAPTLAHAWGGVGHIAVTEMALDAASEEMPDWVNDALFRQRVCFMSNEPDRRRGVRLTCLDHENLPEHYIDIEQLDDFDLVFAELPRLRYDYVLAMSEAMHRDPERFEQDAPDDAAVSWMPGTLPYAIAEDYAKLVGAFRMCRILDQFADEDPLRANELVQARAEAAYHMGILSHWVGDAAQPLHTTHHHNGWIGDNPDGYTTDRRFHAYIDSGVLRAHDLSAATMLGVVEVEPIGVADTADPWPEVLAHIDRAFRLVEPIYILERDEKLNSDEGKAFIVERLADGAGTLAGLYIAAWEQAEPDDSIIESYLYYEAPSPSQR